MLTCWLEQDYTLEGNTHTSQPRPRSCSTEEASEWKVVLFHSIRYPSNSRSPVREQSRTLVQPKLVFGGAIRIRPRSPRWLSVPVRC